MTFCEQILIYPFQTTISFSLIHSSVLWPFSVFDVWFMATEFQLLCHMTYDVKHDGGNNHGVLKHSYVSWRVRRVAKLWLVMLIECLVSLYIVSRHPSQPQPAQPRPESHFRDQSWEEPRRRRNSEHVLYWGNPSCMWLISPAYSLFCPQPLSMPQPLPWPPRQLWRP